ncbi:MAG: hypothetical protein ACREP9_23700 [Candidatus Dormibacteraceae bacterium]
MVQFERTCILLAAICLAGVITACGGGGTGTTDVTASHNKALWYGYGPVRSGPITYQPDVIIVDGGADAIRSASADGLTWTIDGHAPGASDLQPGRIMLVTSRAVGRVYKIEPVGNDIAVTVGPVALTEIVRSGHITLDQPLRIDSLMLQSIPDLPGALSIPGANPPATGQPGPSTEQPSPSTLQPRTGPPVRAIGKFLDQSADDSATFSKPVAVAEIDRGRARDDDTKIFVATPLRLVADQGTGVLPPPTSAVSMGYSIGGWNGEITRKGNQFGANLRYKPSKGKGLVLAINVSANVENPSVQL